MKERCRWPEEAHIRSLSSVKQSRSAHLRLLEVHVNTGEHRQSECSGLSGSRLRLPNHVSWSDVERSSEP